MKKYEVVYAAFRKVVFEAGSQEEAELAAAAMEDDELERNSSFSGYSIWAGPSPLSAGGQGGCRWS
ncbi:hypothetical protein [Otoolea muris]|uniref:hypothetical protein n=1 Tax=Otoolea muris TaxID=2941515 RepID=UPI0013641736|nr:hypothetical protein [Otoolea muris]NBI72359.1 hypothetical protein [Clostridiaceae bacterium]